MTSDDQLKQTFDRDGYVVLRGFLAPAEVAELWRELDRYKREILPGLPATEHFYEIKGKPETLKYLKSLSKHDPYFKHLAQDERFARLARLFLNDEVTCKDISLFNKPPRVGEITPPHQDGFYFMLEPMEALTFWLALDVVDEGNGCVRYLTGSHRQEMRPHRRTKTLGFSQGISDYGTPEDRKNEVPITALPGDLLVHHALTTHRADANTSDRHRHALGLVYYAARARPDEKKVEEYKQSLQRELTAAGKI
ncbi:MAG: phytanoyl-CoA dioxygenase family protein [Opitutus sp.]|nr:phytanoyl-CoA dioxygenase family protein [Opitutus sp.]